MDSPARLDNKVPAEDIHQSGDQAWVEAARRDGEDVLHAVEGLREGFYVIFHLGSSLRHLSHSGSDVELVYADDSGDLGDDFHVYPVGVGAGEGGVARSVAVDHEVEVTVS